MKTLLLALVATVAIAGTARMQEPPKTPDKPMMNMTGMMAAKEAQDKKFDALVIELNAAKGNDRIDKLVAVVNALVAERTAMREHMNGMMKGAK